MTLAADRSNEEYRDLLEQLIEDSESLEVLVNQVLLLSEAVVSEDVSPRTAVPFSDVVSRAVDMFRGVGEVRQIDLQADIEPNLTVLGIRQHLSQVVNNLIDNALKYTPEGGNVTIRWREAPQGRVRIEAAAVEAGLPFCGIWLDTAPDILRARVRNRKGGPSDATVAVLEDQLKRDIGPLDWRRVDTTRPLAETIRDLVAFCTGRSEA